MPIPRMRPSFTALASCPPEDVMAILRERLDDNSQKVEGSFSREHGTLRICGKKRQFWSPCLDLTIVPADESSSQSQDAEADAIETIVWGTFSPRPEIWVGFIFVVGVCGIVSLLAILFAIAQMMLGDPPWALWIPLVAILVTIGIYTSALVGQGLSGDEIYRIRSYLDECLREAEERSR